MIGHPDQQHSHQTGGQHQADTGQSGPVGAEEVDEYEEKPRREEGRGPSGGGVEPERDNCRLE